MRTRRRDSIHTFNNTGRHDHDYDNMNSSIDIKGPTNVNTSQHSSSRRDCIKNNNENNNNNNENNNIENNNIENNIENNNNNNNENNNENIDDNYRNITAINSNSQQDKEGQMAETESSFYKRVVLVLHSHTCKLKNKGIRTKTPSQRNRGKRTKRLERRQQQQAKVAQRRLARRPVSSISGSNLTPAEKDSLTCAWQFGFPKKSMPMDMITLLARQSDQELEEEIYRTQHEHFFNLAKAWKFEGSDVLNTDHRKVHIGQQLVRIATKRRRKSNKNEKFVTKIMVRTTKRLAEAAAVEMNVTPLQVACIQGLPPNIVAVFIDEELSPKQQLQHGCAFAVNLRNDMGRIPLHSIVQCICDGGIPYSEGAEIIDLLCAKDICTIHSSDFNTMSPTELAHIALVRNEKLKRFARNTTMDSFDTKIQTINVLLMNLRRISITSYRLYKMQCEQDHFEIKERLEKQLLENHEFNSPLVGVGAGGGISTGACMSSPMPTSVLRKKSWPLSQGVGAATTFSETHSSLRTSDNHEQCNLLDVFKDCPILETTHHHSQRNSLKSHYFWSQNF